MPSDGAVFSRVDVGSGTLRATKPPPEAQNCVPGSLTYPLDTVVAVDRRIGGLGLRQGPRPLPISAGSFMELPARIVFLEALPLGRGTRDAYRRVPRDAPDPPWSVGTNLGEKSTESGGCSH